MLLKNVHLLGLVARRRMGITVAERDQETRRQAGFLRAYSGSHEQRRKGFGFSMD